MIVETEVMDIRNVELVAKYVDIIRIGARNMRITLKKSMKKTIVISARITGA